MQSLSLQTFLSGCRKIPSLFLSKISETMPFSIPTVQRPGGARSHQIKAQQLVFQGIKISPDVCSRLF